LRSFEESQDISTELATPSVNTQITTEDDLENLPPPPPPPNILPPGPPPNILPAKND
jgi:hypothetical protein